ncbi:Na+/H+ antiporter subunit E [Pelovirga terrestris]|uniref:Na+/H+ antiporter subunit E n=1 Tax=Pelovirga terrestris TaxID=2771352 RepID=A0A8J6QWY2_9BACT|nr:Na+/H+ antiporter subunit E [Pelovirga terrestris]MBD1400338.1 Na+/H+ antiporter subunit E [Pelovirga terrestris]
MQGNRWIPHPLMTVALIVLWLLLNNTYSFGHILLGTLLGIMIPWFTNRFWPERPRICKRRLFLRFFFMTFVYDVVMSNINVVRLILKPDISTLQPKFIEVPLDIDDPMVISILANVISMTPGTVSSEISADHKTLIVHGLNVPDEQAAIAQIKSRYEATLKEIFTC